MIMGLETHDFDIVTNAVPQEIMRIFPHCYSVGAQFGVVVVVDEDDHFQVATFRSDHGYTDGRRPDRVAFTTVEEDVKRRDFTINGILYQPVTGELTDLVGGRKDIDAKIIRTIGDPSRRFREDKLRMIRAVRFAARFDFTIHGPAFDAIKAQAPEILQVSWERIRDELLKILTGPRPVLGLKLLDRTGLLQILLPEITALKGVEQPPNFHPEGDVWNHVLIMLAKMSDPSPTLATAVLLHDVGKPATFAVKERIRFDNHTGVGEEMADVICRRLRLSRRETDTIKALVAQHLRFMHVKDMRPGRLKRFLTGPLASEHLELHRLDCIASHGDLTNYRFCLDKIAQYEQEQPTPESLINGHDLIAAGFRPGPLFKEIIALVEDAQVEGTVSDKQQAHKLVLEHFADRLIGGRGG
jgi:poly(A) polymerase